MRAAWYTGFGPASEVFETGEHATPVAGDGQVLVRVHASGINPLDVKRRDGGRGPMMAERMIPHFDGAGVIEAVGAGVDAGRIGERVWLFEGHLRRAEGTAAEYMAIDATRANPLPESQSFAEGACLGIPAMTAHAAVYKDGPVEGQTILVTGAAGAVGNYAVQMARNGGATVIGTVSSEEKAARAREDGASHTINYKTEDVVSRVKEITDGKGVDRVVEVELGGNMKTTAKILKTGAVIASYASMAEPVAPFPFYGVLANSPTLHIIGCFTMPEDFKQQSVADISRWMAEGKLTNRVAQEFALDDIGAAHATVETGRQVGSVVVVINETG
ncbi:MAG: NADPH:quinone reductase [Alphaproteobacteria bacterium]|nr:NADPH:quinone reductase [Alphaproteobacteria bacterium]